LIPCDESESNVSKPFLLATYYKYVYNSWHSFTEETWSVSQKLSSDDHVTFRALHSQYDTSEILNVRRGPGIVNVGGRSWQSNKETAETLGRRADGEASG
jgi:hypothetical protein